MNVSQNSNGFAENKIQGDWLGIQQTLKLQLLRGSFDFSPVWLQNGQI